MKGRTIRAAVVTAVLLTACTITASAAARPSFTSASANGDVSSWRLNFTEAGLTPGEHVSYAVGARVSYTFMCSTYPSYDHLGIGHGAPEHFRIYRAFSLSLSGTASSTGVIRKSLSVPEGVTAPLCSDGTPSQVSSYGLYGVTLRDTTNNVSAHGLRDHTQPRPR